MKHAPVRAWRLHAMLLLLCHAPGLTAAAHAADSLEQTGTLTLSQAVERALARSPEISAFAPEAEALGARSAADALPPPFVIESELENVAGSGHASGVDALEATVRIARVFELGGKSGLRRDLGAARLDGLAVEQDIRRTALTAEVARRFIRVIADQLMLESAGQAADLALTARDAAQRRVEQGAASPAALGRAEIALARTQIAREHAEHELTGSRVRLSILWGEDSADFLDAAGDLFELPSLESFAAYRARLELSPELARYASDGRIQDLRIRLAQARRSPDVSLAAGVRRLEAFDDQALVASFSTPLGVRRRAELEERAARAERSRVDLAREARRLELHSIAFALYQELLHARTQAETLHLRVQPQAEATFAAVDEGYRNGRYSLLELVDAQVQLNEVQRESIYAAAQFHTLLVDLQHITGERILMLQSRRSP